MVRKSPFEGAPDKLTTSGVPHSLMIENGWLRLKADSIAKRPAIPPKKKGEEVLKEDFFDGGNNSSKEVALPRGPIGFSSKGAKDLMSEENGLLVNPS